MSQHMQKQIRDYSMHVRDSITDVNKWLEDIEDQPIKKKTTTHEPKEEQPIRGTTTIEVDDTLESEINNENTKANRVSRLNDSKKARDGNTIKDYYDAWDKFDPDTAEKDLKETVKNQKENIINERNNNEEGQKKSTKTKLIVKGGRAKQKTDIDVIKETANQFFKERKYQEAIEEYTNCQDQIEADNSLELHQVLYVTVLSNRAQSHINLGDLQKAMNDCNKALSQDSKHVKSQFRRSGCNKKLKNWRLAKADIVKSLQVQPTDSSLKKELSTIERAMEQIKNDIIGKMDVRIAPSSNDTKNFRRIMINDIQDSKLVEQKKQVDQNGHEIYKESNNKENTNDYNVNSNKKDKAELDTVIIKEANPEASKQNEKVTELKYEDFFKAPVSNNPDGKDLSEPADFLRLKNVDGNIGKSEVDAKDKKSLEISGQRGCQSGKRVTFNIYQNEDDINIRYKPNHSKLSAKKSALKYTEAFLAEKPIEKPTKQKIDFDDELLKSAIDKYFKKEIEDVAGIKTSGQFLKIWKAIQNEEKTKKTFLLAFETYNLPVAFKQGMDYNDFSSLIKGLELIKEDAKVVQYLESITKVPRIKMTIKMMTRKEKEAYKQFIQQVCEMGHFESQEEANLLINKYFG